MKKYLLLSLLFMAFIACDDELSEDLPHVYKSYLSVKQSMEMSAEGESKDLQISANCQWTITTDATWLTVSKQSGSNTLTVTITADENATNSVRTAILSIKAGDLPERKLTVTQPNVIVPEPTPEPEPEPEPEPDPEPEPEPEPEPDAPVEPQPGDNLPPA